MKDTNITPDDWQPAEVDDLQVETMAGDIRDILVTKFKERDRPWSMLTQQEQHDLANGLEISAKDLVRRVVRLITATDFQRVVVKVGDLKVAGGDKAGLEAKVTAANVTENREVLCELPGRYAILLCVDSEEFMGEREPVKTDPDQPDLPARADDTPSATKATTPAQMTDEAREILKDMLGQEPDDVDEIAKAEAKILMSLGFVEKVMPGFYKITLAGRNAIAEEGGEAGDPEAPDQAEAPSDEGAEGDDLGQDPETGEAQSEDPDLSADGGTTDGDEAANPIASATEQMGEREWLRALAKLQDGMTSNVPAGHAAKMVEKGHIAVVSPKKGSNPARYAITPAGRAAASPDA